MALHRGPADEYPNASPADRFFREQGRVDSRGLVDGRSDYAGRVEREEERRAARVSEHAAMRASACPDCGYHRGYHSEDCER